MKRLLAVLSVAVVAVAGCGGSGSGTDAAIRKDGSVDLGKVTLHVGDQKAGVQVMLEAAHELSGVKYKITWSQFTSGPPLLEAANAGAIDVGGVGNTPPIFAAAAGSKITVIGAGSQDVRAQAVLVPKNSPIRTIQDLKGKRIALAKGSSAHALLLGVLKKAGLGFTDVRPQYLQPADALSAFSGGKVDAWSIWDPYQAQAQAQTGARTLVSGDGFTSNYNFTVASAQALKDKAKVAALRDYLARVDRAYVWTATHRTEWAQTWAREIGLPLPVAQVAVDRRVTRPVRLDATVTGAEQSLADAFTDAKLLPGRVKFADFVDPRFNDVVPGGSS
ncbi:ABC transporter substrate-binding protein [Actinoallomurus sp. NPDC050550]|uniref:ABC transporter substrate-binding protein n=1 Tax=Actinoallomurus sp. NPDC050550 TaxID=3154937 RepID=UPI0033E65B8A